MVLIASIDVTISKSLCSLHCSWSSRPVAASSFVICTKCIGTIRSQPAALQASHCLCSCCSRCCRSAVSACSGMPQCQHCGSALTTSSAIPLSWSFRRSPPPARSASASCAAAVPAPSLGHNAPRCIACHRTHRLGDVLFGTSFNTLQAVQRVFESCLTRCTSLTSFLVAPDNHARLLLMPIPSA